MTRSIAIVESTKPTPSRSNPRWLVRVLAFVVFFAAIAVVWEGSKAIFALPDYKLPHLAQIVEAFRGLRPRDRRGACC